ncbi:Kinesin-like protein KIN-14S [Linum perenne]
MFGAVASEPAEETTTSMDEGNVSSGSKEFSPSQEPALPILQKITKLSSNIQNLKNDHAILTDEVKKITTGFFVQPEVLSALQLLGKENEQLKKKFVQESTERKRLYNEVIELKGNIRVFCRIRPINQAELEKGSNNVVEFDSSQDNELQILSTDSSKKHFKFDHVFKPDDNQEAVFGETKPIVTSVLDGYNVCIFAYGQTGTGKTFTMEGTPENRGVNYRTLEELFRVSEERKGYMKYELYVSMLEVYNEKLRDLLVENSKEQSKRLDIKQAADGTQEVPGLIESHVSSTEEVWKLLQSGNCIRSVGSTSANEQSSRSHCLLRVTVKGESLIDGQKTRSHLWLVDLAGSERVGKIEVEGERLKESQFINKSLSALGDVISALASKTSHIPYRNSKLTHMLQSSLGGDCKTLMFVQISPSSSDLGETLCSLNFATRVRGIENGPARKHADLNELYKYKQMAEKMKHDEKETKKLQDSVQSLQLRLTAKDSMFRSLQEKARDLENQLEEERRARIKQENRALAASTASVRSSFFPSTKQQPSTENNNNNTITTKPPLCPPSKLRMPLRRITNFMPQQQQPPPSAAVKGPSSAATWKRKENNNVNNNNNSRNNLMKPRRNSVAVRPPPPPSSQSQQVIRQPKRRVSVATYIPEQSVVSTPRVQQMLRGPRRGRFSSLFSPLPESEIVGTPAAARFSSSKFMGSPPVVPGSWKPKHPTVVALQRKKSLVWSPLRGMMKNGGGGGGGGRSRPSYIAAMNQRN